LIILVLYAAKLFREIDNGKLLFLLTSWIERQIIFPSTNKQSHGNFIERRTVFWCWNSFFYFTVYYEQTVSPVLKISSTKGLDLSNSDKRKG
jgi:hypothetical protein